MRYASGRFSFARTDGSFISPGEWISIEEGIGRFMGVWLHPKFGRTCGLSFFRYFENPHETTSLFFTKWRVGDTLEKAIVVDGPMRRNGKRPTAKAAPADSSATSTMPKDFHRRLFKVVEGGAA